MMGYGLSRIPEIPRFFVAIFLIFAIQFLNGVDASVCVFILSIILLFLNLRISNWKFLIFFLSITFLVLFIGNILFSPYNCGGFTYFVFRINYCGIFLGLENSLKRSSMILVGWAWFEATGYQSVVSLLSGFSEKIIGKDNSIRYVGTGFAFASRLGRELSIAKINAELLFPHIYWKGEIKFFKRKFMVWKTILQSLLRRLFDWVSELAFCGERAIGNSNLHVCGCFEVNFSFAYSDDDKKNEIISDFYLKAKQGDVVDLYAIYGDKSSWIVKLISGEIPHLFGIADGYINIDNYTVFSSDQHVDYPIRKRSEFIYYVQSSPYNNFSTVLVRDELYIRSNNIDRINHIIDKLGIEPLLLRNPFSLSGGQAMRVALASALISDVPILLLDAPYSELDKSGRLELSQIVHDVRNDKSKIIIINDPHLSDIDYCSNYSSSNPEFNSVNMHKLISIRDCNVQLGGVNVLKSIDISIYKHSCAIIVGENGSGKTTLLNVIAGQQKMTTGERYTSGIITMVAQDVGAQIVEDDPILQIGYGPINNKECAKHNSWRNRAETFLEKNSLIADTSSMTALEKRLLVIHSVENAEVILFDESTKGMGSKHIYEFIKYIKLLCRSGKAVVIVTHDPELFDFCGNKYIISNGVIKKQ